MEVEPANPGAIDYLRQMYEKRRDWEKLIELKTNEASQYEARPRPQRCIQRDRAARHRARQEAGGLHRSLGRRARQRPPKTRTPSRRSAQLYERARDYEKLADVLEKQAQVTYDTRPKIADPEQARPGLRRSSEGRRARGRGVPRSCSRIQPDDRRAQEQLKKRYVTLGRWDDLEVFYAESGKWDEFIRVLESNEAKAETNEQRIGMLLKIAELWMTQKGKPDRAARAYEKVLELEPTHLAAAERLIPIYTAGQQRQGSRQRDRGQARARRRARRAARAPARGRRALRDPHQRQGEGLRAILVRVRARPARRPEPGGRRARGALRPGGGTTSWPPIAPRRNARTRKGTPPPATCSA